MSYSANKKEALNYISIFDLGQNELSMDILDCNLEPHAGKNSVFTHNCDPNLLPHLPYKDEEFDLALVPNYFFLTADPKGADYYVAAIEELTRVANEARIFPLVTATGEPPSYLGDIIAQLQISGLGVEIRSIQDGNAMMRVWSPTCTVKTKE